MISAEPTIALPALDTAAQENSYRLHRRFDRLGRLYGDGAVERLMGARVLVLGLGGVGSFAAEALARSAVGHLMLVDFDDVCVTNSNRQLQALKGNIGHSKAILLRDRLRLINPQATIDCQQTFYNAARSDAILASPWGQNYDFVVDCIDNLTAKAHLLATCLQRKLPVVSSMGAAGKQDPTKIRVADLSRTFTCPMAREMRGVLRKKHAFPKTGPMGIAAVYSDEPRLHLAQRAHLRPRPGFSLRLPQKKQRTLVRCAQPHRRHGSVCNRCLWTCVRELRGAWPCGHVARAEPARKAQKAAS